MFIDVHTTMLKASQNKNVCTVYLSQKLRVMKSLCRLLRFMTARSHIDKDEASYAARVPTTDKSLALFPHTPQYGTFAKSTG